LPVDATLGIIVEVLSLTHARAEMQPTVKVPGWSQPAKRWAEVAATLLILALPALLFADSLLTYRLHSDDFEYLSNSRTWDVALANLFQPHNTHIVPAWRILTWGVMAVSGSLARLPIVLALVAYLALVVNMLAAGRLVARETGRRDLGLLAMILTGTTSVVWSSATWYSSGQTLWASLGVLAALLCLQSWKQSGGPVRLVAAAFFVWAAGGFWTIGHAAGPVGAVYLAADHRKSARLAAIVPLGATALAVALALFLGGRGINAKISFHGRSEREAANPASGLTHTLQAIPEDLVAQNLGVEMVTIESQGMVLSGLVFVAWLATWVGRPDRAPYPLEVAGWTLVFLAYLVEWTFRGYLPFSSLRGVVPWYDTIPHLGAVLLFTCALGRLVFGRGTESGSLVSPSVRAIVGLLVLQAALFLVHRPRVEVLFVHGIPVESTEPVESLLVTPELRLGAARDLAAEFNRRQRQNLARLDQAAGRARALGLGRDAIDTVFGRVDGLELPPVYNAAGLLGLPPRGGMYDPARVRAELGPLLRPARLPVLSMTTDPRGGLSVSFGPEL
jgi:hypothetical protein